MDLKQILTVLDTLLNAVLQAGLIKDHQTAKATIAARDELAIKADAEQATAADATLKKV